MAAKASELRKVLQGWVGRNEKDGTHKVIIDTYNNRTPRPRGYKVTYKDAWCATTMSAAAIVCGATDICPIECSCNEIIKLAKKMGIWIENENIVPEMGDWVVYDWDDNKNTYKVTDNTGFPEHIGFVEVVDTAAKTCTIIEGNYSDSVKRRVIEFNGLYIRGFVRPNYTPETPVLPPVPAPTPALTFKKGDVVEYTGTTHYTSSTAHKAKACKGGKATVTAVAPGTAHPYHLERVKGAGASVFGWVDADKVKAFKVPASKYYAKYTGKSDKIDEVFKEIGVPSTYIKDRAGKTWAVRKPVAKANGISNYRATAAQNLALIKLAKEGKLVKA